RSTESRRGRGNDAVRRRRLLRINFTYATSPDSRNYDPPARARLLATFAIFAAFAVDAACSSSASHVTTGSGGAPGGAVGAVAKEPRFDWFRALVLVLSAGTIVAACSTPKAGDLGSTGVGGTGAKAGTGGTAIAGNT